MVLQLLKRDEQLPLVEQYKRNIQSGREQTGVEVCIEQTHFIRYVVRVKNKQELEDWKNAARAALFYIDGDIVEPDRHEELVSFSGEMIDEQVQKINNKPKTNPGKRQIGNTMSKKQINPPTTNSGKKQVSNSSRKQQTVKVVEQKYNNAYGEIVRMQSGKDRVLCNDCLIKYDYSSFSFGNLITDEDIEEENYVCDDCNKPIG